MSLALCTRKDLGDYGLPSSLPNPARRIAGVDTDSGRMCLDVHGFVQGTPFKVRAEGTGALPAPLVRGTRYFVLDPDDNTFQVSLTDGGAAVTLTTEGDTTLLIPEIPYDAMIAWASTMIIESLPAHVAASITAPYPPVLVMSAAELANWRLYTRHGAGAVSLTEVFDSVTKRLDKWQKGAPILNGGTNPPAPAQLSSGAVSTRTDSRGWSRFGGP